MYTCIGYWLFVFHLHGVKCSPFLQEVSDIGTMTFNRGGDSADLSTALFLGNELVAPGISALSKHLHHGDEVVMEQVREEWCRCLDKKTLTSGVCVCVCVCCGRPEREREGERHKGREGGREGGREMWNMHTQMERKIDRREKGGSKGEISGGGRERG